MARQGTQKLHSAVHVEIAEAIVALLGKGPAIFEVSHLSRRQVRAFGHLLPFEP
ncbi:hypothetical protein D3C72_2439870 [compost metagenome]